MEQEFNSLADVYTSTVRGKGIVIGSGLGSIGGPIYTRDQNLVKLENDIFSKIAEIGNDIAKDNSPNIPLLKQQNIKTISVEDAIKELLELEAKL